MTESPEAVGRYVIYGKIASGGMASVHFGRLLGGAGFSRTVAIKRLHPHLAENPEFVSTMIDEARMAARIHHPNVVPTLDVVTTAGELLLVMEYVRGESLARLIAGEIARNGCTPIPIVSAIVVGALHGLHAAHEAVSDKGEPLHIVHRDISPQNILVGIDGMARVIDFGVAKAVGRLQMTRAGTIKGKIAYMPPEQLLGRDVTPAGDVYAMGVVLWEALTGKRLFEGGNEGALIKRALAGATEPPSRHAANIPVALDVLVMTALEHDPVDRFATASDMAEALMRAVPPAFPGTVGKWCEEVARESLTLRGALVAEIESNSIVAPLGRGSMPEVVNAAAVRTPKLDGVEWGNSADLVTQSSSMSIETPKPTLGPRASSRRAVITGAVAASAVLLAIVGLVAFGLGTMRAGGEARSGSPVLPSAGAAAQPQASSSAAPSPDLPPHADTAQPAAAPAPLAATPTAASGTSKPAPRTAPSSRSPQRPASPTVPVSKDIF